MGKEREGQPRISRRDLVGAGSAGLLASYATIGASEAAVGGQKPNRGGGRLAGRVALVTGGARGQGRAHAQLLASEGADIVLCDILEPIESLDYPLATPADMDETARLVRAEGRKCLAIKVDVRDPSATIAAVVRAERALGKVDLLVANAGIYGTVPLTRMSDETFDDVIKTNLYGVFHIVRAVLPGMEQRGFGRIVVTSSAAGRMGQPNAAHYSASKWAVIGLVKAVALEVAAKGITINAICPTGVNTPLINNEAAWRRALPDDPAPTREKFEAMQRANPYTPQGVPWVEPEDVARAALFLLSEDARHITGTAVDVTAGGSARNMA